jgi:hypothetical protein
VNLQVNWPTALVAIAMIASITILALHGTIPTAWIERTLSAFVGILVGVPLGRLRSGVVESERERARMAAGGASSRRE